MSLVLWICLVSVILGLSCQLYLAKIYTDFLKMQIWVTLLHKILQFPLPVKIKYNSLSKGCKALSCQPLPPLAMLYTPSSLLIPARPPPSPLLPQTNCRNPGAGARGAPVIFGSHPSKRRRGLHIQANPPCQRCSDITTQPQNSS